MECSNAIKHNEIQKRFNLDFNTKQHEHFSANGIDWIFIYENDGWISLWKKIGLNEYWPKIQSKDINHAEEYCYMCESPNIMLNKLI